MAIWVLWKVGGVDFVGDSLTVERAMAFILVATAGIYLAIMAAIGVFVVRRRAIAWREIGFVRTHPRWYGVAALVLAGWWAASALIYHLFGKWDEILAFERSALLPEVPHWLLLSLVLVCVGPLAALVEEALFRGLIFGWLRVRLSLALAAASSGGLFALVHFKFLGPGGLAGALTTLELFLVGAALAVLFEKSGSLWPGIVLHAVNNLGVVALMLLML